MKSRPTILAAIQYFGHSIYSIKTLGVHLVCNDADILRQTTARLPRSPLITGQISLRAVGSKSKKSRLLPRRYAHYETFPSERWHT